MIEALYGFVLKTANETLNIVRSFGSFESGNISGDVDKEIYILSGHEEVGKFRFVELGMNASGVNIFSEAALNTRTTLLDYYNEIGYCCILETEDGSFIGVFRNFHSGVCNEVKKFLHNPGKTVQEGVFLFDIDGGDDSLDNSVESGYGVKELLIGAAAGYVLLRLAECGIRYCWRLYNKDKQPNTDLDKPLLQLQPQDNMAQEI